MSAAYEITIYEDKCQGCGNCVVACPPNAERSPESGIGFGPKAEQVVLKISKASPR